MLVAAAFIAVSYTTTGRIAAAHGRFSGIHLILRTTTSFSALTLLAGSFEPQNPVHDMTSYSVLSGMLNTAQSIM